MNYAIRITNYALRCKQSVAHIPIYACRYTGYLREEILLLREEDGGYVEVILFWRVRCGIFVLKRGVHPVALRQTMRIEQYYRDRTRMVE